MGVLKYEEFEQKLDESRLYGNDEMVNEGLSDIIKAAKNGILTFVNSVKNAIINAVPAISALYKAKQMPGIQVATNCNDGLPNTVNIKEDKSFANSWTELELANLDTLYNFVKQNPKAFESRSFVDAYKSTGIFEAVVDQSSRAGFKDDPSSSADTYIDDDNKTVKVTRYLRDINRDEFIDMLDKRFNATMHDTEFDAVGSDHSNPLLVFGAPGVGKSTIPYQVMNEFNSVMGSSKNKCGVIYVPCSMLSDDCFSLPVKANADQRALAAYDNEDQVFDADQIAKFKAAAEKRGSTQFRLSMAPASWLPVWEATGDPEHDKQANAIANMCIQKGEKTYAGGIIMLDELLRSPQKVFSKLLILLSERKLGGGEWYLGSKWSFIACSNRPNDDQECMNKLATISTAFGQRFNGGVVNFVPTFKEWKEWATSPMKMNNAGKDIPAGAQLHNVLDVIVDFLAKDKNYTKYFHALNPSDMKVGGFAMPSPRTWSKFSEALYAEARNIADKRMRKEDPEAFRNKKFSYVTYDAIKAIPSGVVKALFNDIVNNVDTNSQGIGHNDLTEVFMEYWEEFKSSESISDDVLDVIANTTEMEDLAKIAEVKDFINGVAADPENYTEVAIATAVAGTMKLYEVDTTPDMSAQAVNKIKAITMIIKIAKLIKAAGQKATSDLIRAIGSRLLQVGQGSDNAKIGSSFQRNLVSLIKDGEADIDALQAALDAAKSK